MTTGNRVLDNREIAQTYLSTPTSKEPWGLVRIGHYSSTVWSGGDTPRIRFKPEYSWRVEKVPFWVEATSKMKRKWVYEYVPRKRVVFESTPVLVSTKRGPKVVLRKQAKVRHKLVRKRKLTYERVVVPAHWEWKTRIKRVRDISYVPIPRNLPENPYRKDQVRRYQGGGEYSERVYPLPDTNSDRKVWAPVTQASRYWIVPYPAKTWTSNDDIKIANKIREKLLGSDFHLGIFMAEGGDALRMIFNGARTVDRALHALIRQRDFATAWRHIWQLKPEIGRYPPKVGTSAASQWLQMQYGILPLLSDVEGAAQYLAERNLHRPKAVVRASKRMTSGPFYNGSNGLVDEGFFYETSHSVKAVLTSIDEPGLLGLTDVASITWEKIGYSFVADWFIPIGNWLNAVNTARSLSGTFVSTKYERWKFSGTDLLPRDSDPYAPVYAKAPTELSGFVVDRSVGTQLSVPFPEVKPFRKIATLVHASNAIALLVNAWGSGSLKLKNSRG